MSITTTQVGGARFASEVLAMGRIVRLNDLYSKAEILGLPNPRSMIRGIEFKAPHGVGGYCTGIVIGFACPGEVVGMDTDGKPLRVLLTGAGCVFADRAYEIPAGSVITKVEVP